MEGSGVLEKARPVIRNVAVMDIGDNAGQGLIPIFDQVLKSPPEVRPKAVVLSVEVSGVSPDPLNPSIQKLDENGIPVFLVSKRYGDERGIDEWRYQTHKRPAEAGAILLKEVNVTKIVEVAENIQTAIDEGKTGKDLKEYVISKYGIAQPAEE